MKKEFLEGYRTIIFYVLATIFYILYIFYGRGLSNEYWLIASSLFIGKNVTQSLVNKMAGRKNDHVCKSNVNK